MAQQSKPSLWDHAAPEQLAAQLQRLYGGAAVVEALWRRQTVDPDRISDIAFWDAVLASLGPRQTLKVALTPALAAAIYRTCLPHPVSEMYMRVTEARADADREKERFWRTALAAVSGIGPAAASQGVSVVAPGNRSTHAARARSFVHPGPAHDKPCNGRPSNAG